MSEKHTIAVLGGSGQEGGALALRWAAAGHRVVIGSRTAQKAAAAAEAIKRALAQRSASANISGAGNKDAVGAADIVVLTVPYSAQRATVEEMRGALTGKILIDATVPLVPPKVARVQLPAEGSAVAAMQRLLGADVRVVSAFQNVSAHHLRELDHAVDCDVLVCGDDVGAREIVIGLAADIGLRAFHAGPIVNSAAAEALTSILIAINTRYKVPGAGIRITGVPSRSTVQQTP
jgi:NADPH-dependent F420 reductase